MPGHDPTVVAEADLTQIVPTEYRADLVLKLGGDEDAWMRRALTATSVGDVFSPDDY